MGLLVMKLMNVSHQPIRPVPGVDPLVGDPIKVVTKVISCARVILNPSFQKLQTQHSLNRTDAPKEQRSDNEHQNDGIRRDESDKGSSPRN